MSFSASRIYRKMFEGMLSWGNPTKLHKSTVARPYASAAYAFSSGDGSGQWESVAPRTKSQADSVNLCLRRVGHCIIVTLRQTFWTCERRLPAESHYSLAHFVLAFDLRQSDQLWHELSYDLTPSRTDHSFKALPATSRAAQNCRAG